MNWKTIHSTCLQRADLKFSRPVKHQQLPQQHHASHVHASHAHFLASTLDQGGQTITEGPTPPAYGSRGGLYTFKGKYIEEKAKNK